MDFSCYYFIYFIAHLIDDPSFAWPDTKVGLKIDPSKTDQDRTYLKNLFLSHDISNLFKITFCVLKEITFCVLKEITEKCGSN